MKVQLTWIEIEFRQERSPTFETPIAIGRTFGLMPSNLEGNPVSRLVLDGDDILDYHALLLERDGRLKIQPRRSQLRINGEPCLPDFCLLKNGDRIQIGSYEIAISMSEASPPDVAETAGCDRIVGVLFPHRCGRLRSEECPHCGGGEIDGDPYFIAREHDLYENYGDYADSNWFDEAAIEGLGEGKSVGFDFTEADTGALEAEATGFERDLTES